MNSTAGGTKTYILGMICSRRLVPLGSRNATHELGSMRECVSMFHAVDVVWMQSWTIKLSPRKKSFGAEG